MKFFACLIAAPLLSACVIHVHVHEEPAEVQTQAVVASTPHRPVREDLITGVVRDTEGVPVAAHVALVAGAGRGSNSSGTRADGSFALPEIESTNLVLHASTADGRTAVASVGQGAGSVDLVVRPGASFVVELFGREKARLAVFVDGLCVEDFTLKADAPATLVVPPGELRLRIYDGDTIYQERHFTARAGEAQSVEMKAHS